MNGCQFPISTKAELDALDEAEIVAGYLEYEPDDPEPGANRSRAYWHGWRNAAIDHGRIQIDAPARLLAAEVAPSLWRKRGQRHPDNRGADGRARGHDDTTKTCSARERGRGA